MEKKKLVSASLGEKCLCVFSFCDSNIVKTLVFYAAVFVSSRHVPP